MFGYGSVFWVISSVSEVASTNMTGIFSFVSGVEQAKMSGQMSAVRDAKGITLCDWR